ncbi:MAG TPA: hypothetical protein VNS08_16220 [Ureibacillus sp.]|nr:hypothetical protein [Ureibacillus sp.]
MSNKESVLDEVKLAQKLLLEINAVELRLLEYRKPVPISVKHFLLAAILAILIVAVVGPVRGFFWFIGAMMLATFIYLRHTSKKRTEQKLEDNQERIDELTKKKVELHQSLDRLNIAPTYLDLEILNKFEYYLSKHLADTLVECAEEYDREWEQEEQLAELRKNNAKQIDLLNEFIWVVKNNNERLNLEEFKRRMKIE